MIELTGKYNEARIYTDIVDEAVMSQVMLLLNQEFAAGSKIRFMPDVHAGAGCAVGTTMTVRDKIVPNLVGADIGCGMETVRIREKRMELQKLDKLIHEKVPSGYRMREKTHRYFEKIRLEDLYCCKHISAGKAEKSLGTLGGGNHFIEVDRAADGTHYLIIHTGSRNLGKQVAEIYQKLAVELHMGRENYFRERDALIAEYKAAGRRREIQAALKKIAWEKHEADMPEDLCYLYGTWLGDYLHDVEICQQFARRNREKIAEVLLERTGIAGGEAFHTIHNYIDTNEMILRKGAIAAHAGEKVLIPVNMRDGSMLAVGRGNPEWNYSAPHGAGRLMSRKKAKETLDMDEYRREMEGIYTTSISCETLDEAPMAYKALGDILDVTGETVTVTEILKPVYNFKAQG